MGPVFPRCLFGHSLFLEQRYDLGIEEFIGLHDWYGHGDVGLVWSLQLNVECIYMYIYMYLHQDTRMNCVDLNCRKKRRVERAIGREKECE